MQGLEEGCQNGKDCTVVAIGLTISSVTPRDCSRMIHFFLSPLSSNLYCIFYLVPLVSIYF
jgi:hypothetical protein